MYNVQFFIQDLIIFNRTNIVAARAIYIKKILYYHTLFKQRYNFNGCLVIINNTSWFMKNIILLNYFWSSTSNIILHL